VGAGISGLAAALSVLDSVDDVQVVVFDGERRPGGRIGTSAFAGVEHVDEGADAFLARVPEAVALARRVGLGDDLVSPEAVGAAVWHDGLHPVPDGLLLGVPGRLGPLARTSLLSWQGKARAALEPFLPRTSIESDSIGEYVRARFGNEVHERLVDALVGSIYAADTDRFSLAEVPQLASLAAGNRSLLLAARRQRAAQGTATAATSPIFAAPRDGMGSLIDATAAAVTAAEGRFAVGCTVASIEPRTDGRWSVITAADDDAASEPFDAVILATPSRVTGAIVAATAPDAAALLEGAETADVIMVTLHVPADEWPTRLHGMSGYLVPKPDQHLVTAASFGSQKWAHWRPPGGGQILRVSLGRDGQEVLHLDDDAVVAGVLADLERHLAAAFSPMDVRITRWPGAFAQYRPHHPAWVTEVEGALPSGVFVTGAGFRGIGIPACVRSGAKVAAQTSTHLRDLEESTP
jgi:oxygen-dependent protoporphyrinogen oxidase